MYIKSTPLVSIRVDNLLIKVDKYTLSLEVQRPLKEWVFTKDHYLSRDLQSTIPRDYHFNGRLDFQGDSKVGKIKTTYPPGKPT